MTAAASIVEQAKRRLIPLLENVIDAHEEHGDANSLAFFTTLLIQAHEMREETQLAALFFELSTTAFQGFGFTRAQTAAIDELLAESEFIAFTLTAPSDRAH